MAYDYCELCGREIRGRAYHIRLEGVTLTVCEKCALKHSDKLISYMTREERRRIRTLRRKAPTIKMLEYDIVEDYAERIRRAREELGLTRELLAREVGEKVSVIRRIEEGKLVPTLELARKLERILGIKLVISAEEEKEEEYFKEYGEELTLGDIAVLEEEGEE